VEKEIAYLELQISLLHLWPGTGFKRMSAGKEQNMINQRWRH